jgi:Fic family protein
VKNIEEAASLKKELDLLRPINEAQELSIWQKFRFDWTYHSNKIEGNSLTFGETKALLLHNITAQGKPLKDHIEISGHIKAIDALLDITRTKEPLTEAFVRNLHKLILGERYRSQATTPSGEPTTKWIEVGTYKTTPNHVLTATGEIFKFSEPLEVPREMFALVQAFNQSAEAANSVENSILAACKVHYEFVRIHPFDDGNGRMARLLMNLLFITHGFPPAIIKAADKAAYLSALQQADSGQFDVFVDYIAACLCNSLKIMIAGAKGLSIEEPDDQDKQIKLLEKLLEQKSKKLSIGKSTESVSAAFNFTFKPLAWRLHQSVQQFAPMYFDIQSNVFKDSNDYFVGATRILDMISDSYEQKVQLDSQTQSLTWHAQFSTLRYEGIAQFSHSPWLNLKFGNAGYEITHTFGGDPIQKAYNEYLSNDEITTLVKAMKSTHIAAIEAATGVKIPR